MYVVYQDGKRADCYHYDVPESWNKCGFDSFFEAAVYAILWSYPLPKEEAKRAAKHVIESGTLQVNKPVDMSMCEVPIMITIKEE